MMARICQTSLPRPSAGRQKERRAEKEAGKMTSQMNRPEAKYQHRKGNQPVEASGEGGVAKSSVIPPLSTRIRDRYRYKVALCFSY